MTILWALLLAVGVAVAAYGSRQAVGGALEIADSLGISTGLVGVTLVAVGTDLPEIANSISASVTGHGDLNVGDSTGSALTQVTLVLAILVLASPAIAGPPDDDERPLYVPIGMMTVAATLVIAILVRDGRLGRLDGILLVAIWMVSMIAVSRWQQFSHVATTTPTRPTDLGRSIAVTAAWLAVVAGAATLIVQAFVHITDRLGVPELVASTVVLALGTSLPELIVDWTAIKRGATALAFGDLFGSSLVDSSLSIGIGPALSPTAVSGEAVWSVLIVAIGIALATLACRAAQSRPTTMAVALLAVYASAMGGVLLVT